MFYNFPLFDVKFKKIVEDEKAKPLILFEVHILWAMNPCGGCMDISTFKNKHAKFAPFFLNYLNYLSFRRFNENVFPGRCH